MKYAWGADRQNRCFSTILLVALGVLSVVTGMGLYLPIGDAFCIGPDEHFELFKGFMVSRDSILYTEIWNDQPPLHTGILAMLFMVFGPSVMVARVLALAFAGLLFLSFVLLIRERSRWIASVAAFVFLLFSPKVPELSASAMLEVPAIGTALFSAFLLSLWERHKNRGLLIGSGVVMGLALQIKFTSAVVAPAIGLELLCAAWVGRDIQSRVSNVAKGFILWVGGMFLGVLAVWMWFPGESYELLWVSHFDTQMNEKLIDMNFHVFSFRELFHHPECVIGAILGISMLIGRRRWRELRFPAVMLLSVFMAHWEHRPYWYYYYLHFAVPLAWLAGVAMKEMIDVFSTETDKVFRFPFKPVWGALGLACLLVGIVLVGGVRFVDEMRWLRARERINDHLVLTNLEGYREHTKWLYTDDIMCAFHARMMMAFPMFVAMALLTSETPKVRWAVLGVLGVLQVVLLGRYLNWYWAG